MVVRNRNVKHLVKTSGHLPHSPFATHATFNGVVRRVGGSLYVAVPSSVVHLLCLESNVTYSFSVTNDPSPVGGDEV